MEKGKYHSAEGPLALIYLVDRKRKTLQQIGYSDSDDGTLNILQYLIDGTGFLTDVVVKHSETGKIIPGAWIAEKYGLRKRPFEERLENMKTWKEGVK